MAKEKNTDADVVEEVVAVAEPTEDELKAELQTAMDANEWKTIAAVSRKIDKLQTAKDKLVKDAAKAAEAEVAGRVGAVITEALAEINASGELDAYEGIWYAQDFGEVEPTVRLTKTATKARKGGGGGGKKFDISTADMLVKHGTKEYKDGVDFATAYESSTDKNWRYAIRNALLKLEGII